MAPASLALCKSINCCPTVGCSIRLVVPPPRWVSHPVRSAVASKPADSGIKSFFIGFQRVNNPKLPAAALFRKNEAGSHGYPSIRSPSPPTKLGGFPSPVGTGEGARRAVEGRQGENKSCGRGEVVLCLMNSFQAQISVGARLRPHQASRSSPLGLFPFRLIPILQSPAFAKTAGTAKGQTYEQPREARE